MFNFFKNKKAERETRKAKAQVFNKVIAEVGSGNGNLLEAALVLHLTEGNQESLSRLLMTKMKTLLPALFLIFVVCACSKKPTPRSAALPDNVVSHKPIVLKEGQAVMLMKEGDRDLMIGASVVDGKLSVVEIDPKGRSFGVTWKDSETWETSTIVSDGSTTTSVLDKNGDGYADFKAETTPSGSRRYELQGEQWVEVKSKKTESEDAGGNRR